MATWVKVTYIDGLNDETNELLVHIPSIVTALANSNPVLKRVLTNQMLYDKGY